MSIFSKKVKEQTAPELYAVCSGKVISCEEIPDEVFSQRILGDGCAVVPSDSNVCSPCSGKVIDVQDTYHAYGIETSDGIEILVHIGINTVELGGKGFTPKVKVGSKVKAGDTLCKVDFDFIRNKGFNDNVVCLITSMDKISSLSVNTGSCQTGDVVITYSK